MTATATDVLNYARTQLGVKENPLGSNNVPYNTWYYGRVVTGSSYPWCAVFVSYVADRAGAGDIIPRHAYTPSGVNWFKSRGRFGSTPRVGAIVYYNISGLGRVSHCGIVEAVHSDGTWTAIEGNTDVYGGRTGGQVMRQRRSKVGTGGGFGYPSYAASPPPPKRDEPPYSTVSLKVQRALNFTGSDVDGYWGGRTDQGVNTIRNAINGKFPFGVREAQARVGTTADGAWGPASKAALVQTTKELQAAWGATPDGVWGPATESAWIRNKALYCVV